MDLRNNRITIQELLAQPGARKIAQREFPQLVSSPLVLQLAGGMTLQQALEMAKNMPRERIERILQELKAL